MKDAIRMLASEDEIKVPPAGFVYWKSQLRARHEEVERAMQPARTMQWVLAGVLGVSPVLVAAAAGMGVVALAAGGFAVLMGAGVVVIHSRLAK